MVFIVRILLLNGMIVSLPGFQPMIFTMMPYYNSNEFVDFNTSESVIFLLKLIFQTRSLRIFALRSTTSTQPSTLVEGSLWIIPTQLKYSLRAAAARMA